MEHIQGNTNQNNGKRTSSSAVNESKDKEEDDIWHIFKDLFSDDSESEVESDTGSKNQINECYDGTKSEKDKYRLRVFHNLRIVLIGFPDDERDQMEELLRNNAGTPTTLEDITATHVVIEEQCITEKPSDCPPRAHVLRAEWFWASIQMDACAAEKMYLFEELIMAQTCDRSKDYLLKEIGIVKASANNWNQTQKIAYIQKIINEIPPAHSKETRITQTTFINNLKLFGFPQITHIQRRLKIINFSKKKNCVCSTPKNKLRWYDCKFNHNHHKQVIANLKIKIESPGINSKCKNMILRKIIKSTTPSHHPHTMQLRTELLNCLRKLGLNNHQQLLQKWKKLDKENGCTCP